MITKDNVERLWELYELYNGDKDNKIRYGCFEDYVFHRVFKCTNCGEYYDEDEKTCKITQDGEEICNYCVINGYGS